MVLTTDLSGSQYIPLALPEVTEKKFGIQIESPGNWGNTECGANGYSVFGPGWL